MSSLKKEPHKGDPSDVLQLFPAFDLKLHCCRYWWLQNWEFNELSFPYWRIYHNSYQGAVIKYNNIEYKLTPDKIVIIAPNTSYSTRINSHTIPNTGYAFRGGRINSDFTEKEALSQKYILHLFIHFNLGIPYDNISPGIFTFTLTNHLKEKLTIIKKHLNYEHAKFNFSSSIAIQSLICDLLVDLPKKKWNLVTKDHRILYILNYIENNLTEKLGNTALSQIAKMSTNSFARLFTQETNNSPQQFIKKKRIDKACILLHHSNLTIDEIATLTGFSDRYHFSRIFKQIAKFSPAQYRKEFAMK